MFSASKYKKILVKYEYRLRKKSLRLHIDDGKHVCKRTHVSRETYLRMDGYPTVSSSGALSFRKSQGENLYRRYYRGHCMRGLAGDMH
jgi:hypothetical protein